MTVNDISGRVAAWSPERRELLQRRLRQAQRPEDTFPLSSMQQRLWFLEQLTPHNPAYVLSAAVRVQGPLDTDVLRVVVTEIARRHESLRTTFATRDGQAVQVVAPPAPLALTEDDLTEDDLPGEGVARRMAAELARPFDLATGPLLRLRLLRRGASEHVLLVAMHHIISDGWSLGILVTELAHLYEAFVAGRPSGLPELPIQYGDYATWQRRRDAGHGGADLAYWRERLAGAPSLLAVPTDRPRPPVQTFAGGSVPLALSADLVRQLAEVARRHGATTYMALLAAFSVLLHRHSNSDDIVVGVPTANRSRAELEGLIGFFVNTLPVRTDLSGDPSLGDVLERVRDACLGAYGHQEVTFERLVEELRPARDLSRPPICQVSFSYQSAPLPTLEVAGLRLSHLALPSTTARFDLELQCLEDAGGLRGWFEFNRDLFDPASIARMASQFERLVRALAADPTRSADRVPLLSEDEWRATLLRSEGPVTEWPGQGLVHECVQRQAALTPDADALRFGRDRMSYRELNRRANQLAHRLRRAGVGRDVLVGVCMERSPELVVGVLAVLKAGGAYVPLDPSYPAARLQFMIEDSRLPVLLSRRAVLDRVPRTAAEVLCLDEPWPEVAEGCDRDPDAAVAGADLAYVIYTSGSTGQPKGAMNVHAAIRNRLLWMQDAFRLEPTDVVLQKTPISFDVSVWELFWPLMTGATLVLARPGGHKDPRCLVDTIRDYGVTTVHFVPSMLQILLREPDVASCSSLRRVLCSGEALPRDLQERFFAQSPAELHNLYGPTEAAVDVTWWPCRRDHDARSVPIGFPIANTQIYVLDRLLQPVPVGVPGELCIGGRNLARGYLNRPQLTAERFVSHPFAGTPGARVYRTGDLARVRGDGAVEYLGRLDHQVKVRGQRIELGEIEAVLVEHPAVVEAIVTAHEHAAGDVRIVAYVTGVSEPSPTELMSHLRRRLPDYMVPATFVFLSAFPLSPNGKVDRSALPAPRFARPGSGAPYEAPRDRLEHAIGEVWQRLLCLPRVGVHDNFFDLGGHSLLMVEARDAVQTMTGRQLSMVEMFQHPTVRTLAEYLNQPTGPTSDALASAQERGRARRDGRDRQHSAAMRRASTRDRS